MQSYGIFRFCPIIFSNINIFFKMSFFTIKNVYLRF